MADHSEGTFAGAGELALFYQSWCPAGSAQAVVGIVPGTGDHTGRYENLVGPLVQGGTAVFAFDLRGFGRSAGKKGHINYWEEYRADVRAFLRVIQQRMPETPLFLFGYSLGAAIVLDFILSSPDGLKGAILSATPIEPVGVAPKWQMILARLLSRAWPEFTIKRTADINGVTRDPTVIAALQVDPLHHDLVTARWGTEAMAVTDLVRTQAGQIRLPVLFIHGGDDPYNTASGVQRYYEQIPYADKVLKIYPGSRHETHNDLDHEQVAADILEWIENHL